MDIAFNISHQVKLIHDTLLLRHRVEFEIDRPIQAWQWMNQARTVPEQQDWVRPEVRDAWERCLDGYHLPLGHYANWDDYPIIHKPVEEHNPAIQIKTLLQHLSHNFYIFLKEADVMLVLIAADGRVLYTIGEQKLPHSFMSQMYKSGANWSESILGNNGIGSTLFLKKPIAFQGMEHFLNVLHPFTTVGYPLLDAKGELQAVIGLVSNQQESMNSLFAFLHLICVLVNSNLPLALNTQAQERVLEKIHFNTAKNTSPALNNSFISQELETLLNKAVKLQQHKVPILITGESGVGKDHFVRLLKQAGARKDAPLVAINCASIPRDLIESELFGYEAGSFTGAKASGKAGKFMQADKGILFLDEIGDMSLDLQSTLLRVLENSEFTPIGGSKPIRVDVQVVAATNVKLSEAVAAGRFRRDLYYRLNGCTCHLQALRDNPDKKTIVQHILQRELNIIAPDGQLQICPEVIELIEQHPWPGNIRQLISVIRATLYTASSSYITVKDLPIDFLAEMDNPQQHSMPSHGTFMTHPPAVSLTDWEFHGIKTALQHCAGNISMAAKKLGITRTTLYKKMDRFGLSREGENYVL